MDWSAYIIAALTPRLRKRFSSLHREEKQPGYMIFTRITFRRAHPVIVFILCKSKFVIDLSELDLYIFS